MEVVFDTVDNIVGKGENAGYHHFLWLPPFSLFPAIFSKLLIFRVVNTQDYVVNP